MSAGPARRHLALVDAETGEVVESRELHALQAEVERLQGDLKQAERDLRAKRRRIGELERDRARERLEHPQRDLILRVLRYWHRRCRDGDRKVHAASPARFDAVAGLVEMQEIVPVEGKKRGQRQWRYQMEDFKAAVDGAHFDHYSKKRKNGSEQHYDDIELICRDSKQFEEFRARCPYEVRPILPARPSPEEVASGRAKWDNPGRVPTPSPGQAGTGKQQEGSRHGTNAVGAAPCGGAVRVEGRGLQLRGWLGACGPGAPAV